ncbi:kinase-like domain-containing protein [Mycena rosella]|uniref:Kinase-like domain-containing protein n=1 Tax=Mycena rosella TaxID=1033263 RepID=A0AAD7DB60_MYCRO|nr:kinase-like domain-containing protein [Mycena rosella]
MARPGRNAPVLRRLRTHQFSANGQVLCGAGNAANAPSNRRYIIHEGCLGRGRYSRVVPATDTYTNSAVAIKIMARQGPRRFSEMRDWFVQTNAFCIVFDRFGATLAEILSDQTISSIPHCQAKEISRQLIQATRFLHSNGVIHTDLNPVNVMLVDTKKIQQRFYGLDNVFHDRTVLASTEIRLIDFGSVDEEAVKCKGLMGSIGYQAPEVVMGTPEETLTVMDRLLGPFSERIRASIECDLPTSQDHPILSGLSLSARTTEFLQTTTTLEERIGDPDATRLVRRLTSLDPAERGTLRHHEKCRFGVLYEM